MRKAATFRTTVLASTRQLTAWTLLAIILTCALSGCLAPYDKTSDESITSIQKRLDLHIDSVASSPPDSPLDAAFFATLRTDLRSLRMRTEARGDDPSLARQAGLLDLILEQLGDVEELEQERLRGSEAWQTTKDAIATTVKGFLTAELARKYTPD